MQIAAEISGRRNPRDDGGPSVDFEDLTVDHRDTDIARLCPRYELLDDGIPLTQHDVDDLLRVGLPSTSVENDNPLVEKIEI